MLKFTTEAGQIIYINLNDISSMVIDVEKKKIGIDMTTNVRYNLEAVVDIETVAKLLDAALDPP